MTMIMTAVVKPLMSQFINDIQYNIVSIFYIIIPHKS